MRNPRYDNPKEKIDYFLDCISESYQRRCWFCKIRDRVQWFFKKKRRCPNGNIDYSDCHDVSLVKLGK